MVDISRFKVVYGDKVLNAVHLINADMGEDFDWQHRECIEKVKRIEILAINEDGNLISIKDEAWMFQFLPIVGKQN